MVRGGWGIGLGDPVVAPRRVIALPTDAEQRQHLLDILDLGPSPRAVLNGLGSFSAPFQARRPMPWRARLG